MTTTAKTDVVNAAMAHMGEPPFETIAPAIPSAALVKVLGQLEGRAGTELHALSRHPWLCALSYASLSPSLTIPANWKWAYAFALPATFVKMWAVNPYAADPEPYSVESYVDGEGAVSWCVRANVAALDVAFTEQKPFEAYSPDLCNYIGFKLAARTAGPLKGDYDGARRLEADAERALGEAVTGEAGQHHDDQALAPGGFAALRAAAG